MTCPICKKATSPDYRPFCSSRCADIDLGRWLNEDYAIPAGAEDDKNQEINSEPDPAERPH